MSELANIFKEALSTKYTTPDELAKNFPEGVTLIGFRYVELKGAQVPSYRVAEDGGMSFLSSGKVLTELTTRLENKYGTAEAIDAALRAEPQRIRIHPVMDLPNGRKFRLVEFLDETVDAETGEIS